MYKLIMSFLFWPFLGTILLSVGCASTQTASYHYAQKQIEHGDLDFHKKIRVNEYINAFPQDEIVVAENQDLLLKVDSFSKYQPSDTSRALIQVALKTRQPNEKEKRNPIGLCFVLDVSGSMSEDHKLADAKSSLVSSIAELQDGDELALVVFNTIAKTVIPPTIINQQTRTDVIDKIASITAGGSTNLEAGLVSGYIELAKFRNSLQKRLLLLTDGRSNVGIITPQQIARKAEIEYIEGARISTIGLGIDVDENLLREISKNGSGHYYFAENGKALTTILREGLRTTVIPVAKNVFLNISVAKGFRLVNIYGGMSQIKTPGETVSFDMGELNANDWRIIIVEIEGNVPPGEYSPLSAMVSFASVNSMANQSSSVKAQINWHKGEVTGTASVNINVARNSIVFGNATCLVKIGELSESGKYNEALSILDLQINNNKILAHLDNSASMAKELESLNKIRNILVQRIEESSSRSSELKQLPTRDYSKTPERSPLKTLVIEGLKIASASLPGIWGTAAKLFIVLIQ